METLPPELIDGVLGWTPTFVRPIMRVVCQTWSLVVDGQRSRRGVNANRARTRSLLYSRKRRKQHVCKSARGCFLCYARHMIDRDHGHTIERMLQAKTIDFNIGNRLDVYLCKKAARQGDLKGLQGIIARKHARVLGIIGQAARGGHLPVLKWLRKRYKAHQWSDYSCAISAIKEGHEHVLGWLKERAFDVRTPALLKAAAKRGRLRIVQELIADHGIRYDDSAGTAAACRGHIHVLTWFSEQGYPITKDACIAAARGGHLGVLQLLIGMGCAWSKRVCSTAAAKGHLAVLQWARTNGCPWDQWTCANAAKGGHLEVLKWATANGCPHDIVCRLAAQSGHLEVLRWARSNGHDWDASVCRWAATRGDLPMLQWALDNGCPYDMQVSLIAARKGCLDILIWLRSRGYPMHRDVAHNAHSCGRQSVVEWVATLGCSHPPVSQ